MAPSATSPHGRPGVRVLGRQLGIVAGAGSKGIEPLLGAWWDVMNIWNNYCIISHIFKDIMCVYMIYTHTIYIYYITYTDTIYTYHIPNGCPKYWFVCCSAFHQGLLRKDLRHSEVWWLDDCLAVWILIEKYSWSLLEDASCSKVQDKLQPGKVT